MKRIQCVVCKYNEDYTKEIIMPCCRQYTNVCIHCMRDLYWCPKCGYFDRNQFIQQNRIPFFAIFAIAIFIIGFAWMGLSLVRSTSDYSHWEGEVLHSYNICITIQTHLEGVIHTLCKDDNERCKHPILDPTIDCGPKPVYTPSYLINK